MPQQQVWVPFLNPTLFSIRKREKDLPWSTLPPVLQPGCLGHPCDPETERESKGESRYPTPHPQRCGAQRPGKASNPAQLLLLLLLSTLNRFFKVCTFIMRNQQSPQRQEGSHVCYQRVEIKKTELTSVDAWLPDTLLCQHL